MKFNYGVQTNLLTEDNVVLVKSLKSAVEKETLMFIQKEDGIYSRCIVNSGNDFERRESLIEEFNRNVAGFVDHLICKGYSNV